jgi:hypothetical protein
MENHVRPLTIAIDPSLDNAFAPEISWTWRYLLTGAGYPWRTGVCHEPCDIAYTPDPQRAPHARIVIQAMPHHWERRTFLRLAGVRSADGFMYLVYAGEHGNDRLITNVLEYTSWQGLLWLACSTWHGSFSSS